MKTNDGKIKSRAAFQAALAAEVEKDKTQDKFVRACYNIQSKFKLDINQIRDMPATHFFQVLKEMETEAKEQKKEMEKARRRKR